MMSLANRLIKCLINMPELTVKIFTYINPVVLNPINSSASWYREKKVVYNDGKKVIVFRDGYRVEYTVQCYWFRKVDERKIERLIDYVKKNPKGTYQGWLHHYNRYDRMTKSFIPPQMPIDYEL